VSGVGCRALGNKTRGRRKSAGIRQEAEEE
jgi:hypothetical protein